MNIDGGAFLRKKLKTTVANIQKKALPQTFGWVLNTALGNTVKKWLFKKIIPWLCKTSCVIILIFSHK